MSVFGLDEEITEEKNEEKVVEFVKCHFNEWYSGTGRYADNCPERYCEIPAQPDL